MWIGPPNVPAWPKPMSSISTIRTFGAPSGALTSKRAGGVALRASTSVIAGYDGSASGSTVRSIAPAAATGGGGGAALGVPLHAAVRVVTTTSASARAFKICCIIPCLQPESVASPNGITPGFS